jgi:hypothetical protein
MAHYRETSYLETASTNTRAIYSDCPFSWFSYERNIFLYGFNFHLYIILNINNFLISGSSLIKIPALEVRGYEDTLGP